MDKRCTLLNVHRLEANAKSLILTFTVPTLSLFSVLGTDHKDTGSGVAQGMHGYTKYTDLFSSQHWVYSPKERRWMGTKTHHAHAHAWLAHKNNLSFSYILKKEIKKNGVNISIQPKLPKMTILCWHIIKWGQTSAKFQHLQNFKNK